MEAHGGELWDWSGLLASMWSVWLELAPWLFLGALVAGAMHVLLPKNLVSSRLRGPWAPLLAVVLGIPLPLCSCGVIPAAVGLKRDGASDGATTGFLIATPQTGVDSFFVSASMLGWPFALFKVGAAMLMGLLGGYWVDMRPSPEAEQIEEAEAHSSCGGGGSPPSKWKEGFTHGIELIDNIAGWLVIGVVVSVLITWFIPTSAFGAVQGWGIFATAAAVLMIALPMYVCATASVPIAAALVANGLPMSAALIFLLAGPATNVTTIATMYQTIGLRALLIYLASIVGGSVLLGAWMDAWLTIPNLGHHIHHHGDQESWFYQLCGVLLVIVVARSFILQLQSSARRFFVKNEGSYVLSVEGMHCDGCARALERRLMGTDGVDSAVVDFSASRATVMGDIDRGRVRELIQDAGYRVDDAGYEVDAATTGMAS